MDKSRKIWASCELIYFSRHFAPYFQKQMFTYPLNILTPPPHVDEKNVL